MCSFKSVIALKDRVFCPDYDSHDKMLGELKIEDDYIGASKTFVRVELSPADGRADSDVEGWRLKVDQDVTPDWWDETADLPRIKAAVKAWCDNHVLKEGKHEVHDGVWYASDSAKVIAYDSATVNASGSATVIASDSATVRASDSATVNASGSTTVNASDSATVTISKYAAKACSVTVKDSAVCIDRRSDTIATARAWHYQGGVIAESEHAVAVNRSGRLVRSY